MSDAQLTTNSHHTISTWVNVEIRFNRSHPLTSTTTLQPGRTNAKTATMNPFVFHTGNQAQILDAIVELVLIDVMNLFPVGNRSVVGFPNQYMFKFVSSIFHHQSSIAILGDRTTTGGVGVHRHVLLSGFHGNRGLTRTLKNCWHTGKSLEAVNNHIAIRVRRFPSGTLGDLFVGRRSTSIRSLQTNPEHFRLSRMSTAGP